MPIVPPAEALNKGTAEISLTDQIVPELKFEFNANTVPSLLENLSSLVSSTSSVITEEPAAAPVKTILGFVPVAVPLFPVILIFLSEFAILSYSIYFKHHIYFYNSQNFQIYHCWIMLYYKFLPAIQNHSKIMYQQDYLLF
jgi:hypothetical protein